MEDKTQKFSLGIDLGTSSVKICLIDCMTNEVQHSVSKPSYADVNSSVGSKGSEQNPCCILTTLKECLELISPEYKKLIEIICVTGQMHGVMMWAKESVKNNFISFFRGKELGGNNPKLKISNLYTWQDQRCSSDFLSSLPKPDSHLPLATGHGCATMLWLNKHDPDFISGFDCSGTVMDFLVAGLCGLEKPITSVQLAASWGYFNTREMVWNYSQLAEGGLHVNLLPYVVCAGHTAGNLQFELCGIRPGTSVLAGLGDVHCAVYSVLKSPQDAVVNMSTSCQLAFAVREELVPLTADDKSTVQYFPYFDDSYLAVAAGLNGGNVLSHFIKMLQEWMSCFGFQIEEEKMWDTLLKLSKNKTDSKNLKIIPTLFGERHDPQKTASLTGAHTGNLDLGNVFRSICSGLLDNLSTMMPVSFLEEKGITNLIGSGSLLSRNEVMRQEVKKHYENLTVEFGSNCDSASGAATYALKYCKENIK